MSNRFKCLLAMAIIVMVWTGAVRGAVIHDAAAKGDVATVKAKLLDDPDWINETDNSGFTPLLLAARHGRLEVVKLLLANNADPNAAVESGWEAGCTALHFAIEHKQQAIVDVLLAHGAKPDIFVALAQGEIDKIKEQLGAHPEMINIKGPFGRTLLHGAVLKGDKEMVEWLVNRNADVNAKTGSGYSPIQDAANRGYLEIVELLLAHHADVNDCRTSQRLTPLHFAASKNHKEVVEALLAHKADVNAMDDENRTPLYWGLQHQSVVETLLIHGAAVNIRDNRRESPLAVAKRMRYTDIIKLLLQHGAKE